MVTGATRAHENSHAHGNTATRQTACVSELAAPLHDRRTCGRKAPDAEDRVVLDGGRVAPVLLYISVAFFRKYALSMQDVDEGRPAKDDASCNQKDEG